VARRRLFISALCRILAVVGILVAAAVLVLVLVDRAFALDSPMPIAVVSCIGIGVLVSLARSYVWGRPGTLAAAAEADRRLDLSERLSTALYLGAGKDEAILAEWRALVIRDGGRVARGAEIRPRFPLRVPRRALWAFVPAVIAVAVFFWMPVLDLAGIGAVREADARIEKEAKNEVERLDQELQELVSEAKARDLPE